MDCYDEQLYRRPKYDVFVNYVPCDIGNGFTSHLIRGLKRECFTISGHNKLTKGQEKSSELLKAIKDSEIYLVLFSPKYASSMDCLDELALIMESYPKFKYRKVFPIFFNVEPSDVRNQQGLFFLEPFQGYEKNVDPERVQIWRKALKEAGDKTGRSLKDWDEERLIRKIIKDVIKMKVPQHLCNVEHPVGIKARAQDIISALRLGDQSFTIVAVLGLSGTGKTASVKAVYDMIAPDFDDSCFIQNISTYGNREADLQRDVISFLTGKDMFRSHHNDGAARIKMFMSSRKVLLVLDDVRDSHQLEALIINSSSFHRRSRIIVTTINKQSLSCLHSYIPYNIRLLDDSESFQLFTGLTFGDQDKVEKNFVDEIVWRAGGIPLVLKIWSRHFRDNERKLWPSMLETLKRIPHQDTQKKFRIIYDLLPKRSQNLFLDIACFFNGMFKDTIVKVLQDEDFFPDLEIQNLVNKFLVKNESPWIVSLHDVIREMGQEVVRQEDEDDPGKRTRLMGYRDVVRVLRDCLGTDSARSIHLYSSEKKERVTVQFDALKKMSNLRFIKLDDSQLEWSPSSNDDMSPCFSFKHLKYLEWRYFGCKSLDNIDMANVVIIKLEYSKLETLWEGVKSLKKLKILDVFWSSSITKTGNFDGLENLEELNLRECSNLEEVHSSIGCLQKLVKLDLSGCKQLKRFPWKMIGKLTSLQNLHLCYFPNILEISHEVGSQIALKHFNTIFNRLLNSMSQLQRMTKLELSYCANLRSIPDLPLSVEELYVADCINLVNLPSNCYELQMLTRLRLDNCLKLGSEGFTQVTRLRNLRHLRMKNCNVSQVSSRIGNLVSLVFLDLTRNPFSSLPDSFSNLSELQSVLFNVCSELQLLPPLPSQLRKIEATYCWSLYVMPFDTMQNAYIFRSKAFMESRFMSNEGLHIILLGKEVPEWCTYRNSGNVISFVVPNNFDKNICGLILCVIRGVCDPWVHPAIYNKTKGTSHRFRECGYGSVSMLVVFYPLNDTTLLVEACDTVELRLNIKSFGLRLVYEDDVVDSGLVLKDIRKPALSLVHKDS